MELTEVTSPLSIEDQSYFDHFFEQFEYNLEIGRGFSLFNADESAIADFIERCKQSGFSPPAIRFSATGDTTPVPPNLQNFVIIIQDLSFPEFLNRAAFFADQIIFPLWFKKVPMCFFSIPERGVYDDLSLGGNELHNDYQMVVNSLLCEQILILLERVNHQSSPVEASVETIKKTSKNKYALDDDLDSSQMAAVNSLTGPIRVLAPAGSGKTKTLINRILNLLNHGVPPEKILALAFNKKARDEMQERLERKKIHDIEVRTFHSLGYEIVRKNLGWKFSGSSSKQHSRELMRSAIQQNTELPPMRNKDPLDAFLDGLRRAKMDLPQLTTLTVEYGDRVYPFEPIFYSYLKAQLDRKYLDFNDMIYLALRTLLDDKALRQAYQSQFEFILVDEFQDLNQAQLLLLQILSLPENNIFAVGDDDQMIYGFRGAEVRHIIEFDKRFPVSVSHVLNTNYRSSKAIVRHSGWLVDHNSDRIPKNIQSRQGAQEGSFEVYGDISIFEQAKFAAQWLVEHKKQNNPKWSDYAFLYRYNAYQFPVVAVLDMLNVPHTPLSGQHLFQSRVGKDIYSYLQVILSPLEATSKDFERILKRPNKYFTNRLIARARNWNSFLHLPQTPKLRDWEKKKLADFVGQIQNLGKIAREQNSSPMDFMQVLKTVLGLSDFYRDEASNCNDLDQASDEDIFEIVVALSENFKTVPDYYHFVCRAVDENEGEAPINSGNDTQRNDEVYLGTIHRAKGKEFQNVVYFNLGGGSGSAGKAGEEEERRVAYVGTTRPKDSLLITFPSTKPSKFLPEICLNPKYKDYTNEYLDRKSASLKMRLRKEQTKLKQIEQHKENLALRSYRLTDSPIIQKTGLLPRFSLALKNWRIQRIHKKINTLNEKIEIHSENIIAPLTIEMNEIEEEIHFRGVLTTK
jgi:DNA helicase-2/ATP-dependent DNA helicase PcrA